MYFTPNELAKKVSQTKNTSRQIGVIAQQVEKVLPEIISIAPFDANKYGHSKSGENYLTVAYEKLVPLLIEALKIQKEQIDYIKSKIKRDE